jgi:hypothetical protein
VTQAGGADGGDVSDACERGGGQGAGLMNAAWGLFKMSASAESGWQVRACRGEIFEAGGLLF